MRVRVLQINGPLARDWNFVEVERTLSSLQSLVGGPIERVPVFGCDKVNIFVNEDGKRLLLPATADFQINGRYFDTLLGRILVMGPVDDQGKPTNITDEAIKLAHTVLVPLS